MDATTGTSQESVDDLLRHVHYTPEDLAELLGTSPYQIRHAVRTGELPAITVDHHVLSIRREDVVRWLARFHQ